MAAVKPPAMVEDVDYMLTGVVHRMPHPNGSGWVHNTRVVQVYLAQTNAETWMCDECRAYTNDNPRSVWAHRASHGRNQAQAMLEKKAAAFDLLPKAIQGSLLKRLKDEGSNGRG